MTARLCGWAVTALAGVVFWAGSAAAQVTVEGFPEYKAAEGVSGNMKSIGSDTMNNLMALWAEGFHKFYPNVQLEVEGKGSTTAPPALISGAAHFGPMSRAMKQAEIDKFEQKFGYKPIGLKSSIDMLAVYVNKDNPIKSLTMQQLDAIFSKTRKAGGPKDIVTWGDLGLEGEWADKPISIYGRNSASGTYGYLKEHVLLNGDYKDSVKEQPGSSSVVQGVASDRYAIGYSGIGYKTADVRAVPLAKNAKSEPIEASAENAYKGQYPLARFLFIYVNYKPNSQLDPLRREFVKYLFSKQGQQDVIKDGYIPITATIAQEALKAVAIEDVAFTSTDKP
ncbi:MAG TPA: phosphate ABC transporter substrate-binding protein PstS family protein [Gemmataceae bacterium]|jgi:phosphate transport system substrate-binding protein|nr:phosphate ABC transporter substrate-binding protein PstS family protein [Gemmataceae bacterium]